MDDKRKKRKCLACSKEFMSGGPGNRICKRCKDYQDSTNTRLPRQAKSGFSIQVMENMPDPGDYQRGEGR